MAWLWILLGVITALVWGAVFFPGIPWWIAAVVTGVAVLVVITVIVVRRVTANRRADALEKELLRQAGAQAEHARPDRRAEILQLQAQMKAAIAALKKSKLGARGGQAALYALPWYVIVGPPASGKTTALEQSGLAFVGPGGGAPKVRGTAGTKNCDWWFSKDAILLDTAGRFAITEEDPEWMAFLDTVKKFRAERPLDGIIVAVSLSEIMSAGDSQIEDLATKLRARIEEVMTRFEMVLPVYVMFTKTDLVAGFVEFWSDLGKQNRGQVWGSTFLIDDERLAEPQAAFDAEFDELTEALHARLVDRLPQERMPEARARTLQFPLEFQSLKPVLGRFLEELCKPNPYHDAPIVRGFYFTSGTQVGRPLDRVLAGMAQGFNLRPGMRAERAPGPTHSYFVTDLFKTIIFPDRNVAMRSTTRVKRRLRRQILYIAAALFMTLFLVIPAVFSYLDNADMVNATGKQVADIMRIGQEKGQGAVTGSLASLLQRTQELEAQQSSFSVPWWWGPYTADTLYQPVHGFYVDRLRTVVEGPVKTRVVEDVQTIASLARADAQNFVSAYNDLRLYVMMLEPQHLAPEWAAEKLAAKWARVAAVDGSIDAAQLQTHAKYYIDALAADHSLAWAPDAKALADARARLLSEQLEDLQYKWLIASIGPVASLRPGNFFRDNARIYVDAADSVEVPGIYTKVGWEKARVALESENSALVLEPWVLGSEETSGGAQLASSDRVREIYFRNYISAWRRFLLGMTVKAPTNVQTAVEELRVLSDAEGPYGRLFRAVSENGRLDMSPPSLAGKMLAKGKEALTGAIDKVKGTADAGAAKERKISTVERELRPIIQFSGDGTKEGALQSGLGEYLSILGNLSVDIGTLVTNRGEPTADFQNKLATAGDNVQRLLRNFDVQNRTTCEPLLMNPIRGSRTGVASSAYSALDEKWKAEVWTTYSEKIAPRFPFNLGAPNDVAIPEFAEFFRPQTGILWGFFEKNLADRLVRAGSSFTVRPGADQISLNGGFMACLQKAQEITDAVFGAGAEPGVQFTAGLEPAGSEVSEVSFTVDGLAFVYRNEPPQPFPMVWPGKGATHGGVLKITGAGFQDTIPRPGDFGLFRLLQFGNLKQVSSGRESGIAYAATYALSRPNQPPVNVTIRPNKTTHPFGPNFFKLNCPAVILAGGASP